VDNFKKFDAWDHLQSVQYFVIHPVLAIRYLHWNFYFYFIRWPT